MDKYHPRTSQSYPYQNYQTSDNLARQPYPVEANEELPQEEPPTVVPLPQSRSLDSLTENPLTPRPAEKRRSGSGNKSRSAKAKHQPLHLAQAAQAAQAQSFVDELQQLEAWADRINQVLAQRTQASAPPPTPPPTPQIPSQPPVSPHTQRNYWPAQSTVNSPSPFPLPPQSVGTPASGPPSGYRAEPPTVPVESTPVESGPVKTAPLEAVRTEELVDQAERIQQRVAEIQAQIAAVRTPPNATAAMDSGQYPDRRDRSGQAHPPPPPSEASLEPLSYSANSYVATPPPGSPSASSYRGNPPSQAFSQSYRAASSQGVYATGTTPRSPEARSPEPRSPEPPYQAPHPNQQSYGYSGQPSHGQPSHGQSSHGQSSHGQPSHGQPTLRQRPSYPPDQAVDPYSTAPFGSDQPVAPYSSEPEYDPWLMAEERRSPKLRDRGPSDGTSASMASLLRRLQRLRLMQVPTRMGDRLGDAAIWMAVAVGVRLSARYVLLSFPLLGPVFTLLMLAPAALAVFLVLFVPKAGWVPYYRLLLLMMGLLIGGKF